MSKTLPPISVGFINYNGKEIIERTLISVFESDYHNFEVIVVDDASTDDSVSFIKEKFPDVRVFSQPENKGPNAARNRVLQEAKEEIVFVSDNDITLAPDCLKLLVETMTLSQETGVATPMVLDSEDRNKIYSNGAKLHYVCFGMVPDRYQNVTPDMDLRPRKSVCGSGGIMLIRKGVARNVGWLDEDFYFGYDDGEFTYRVTLAGYSVMQVPMAKVYHVEKAGRRTDILRYQIRGRADFILKTYSTRSLLLLSPALALFELLLFLFLVSKGAGGEWFRGMSLVIKNFGHIMDKRKTVQKLKKCPDKELLTTGEILMAPGKRPGGVILKVKRAVELFLDGYWRLVQPLLTK